MDFSDDFENEERFRSFDLNRDWTKKVVDYNELRALFVWSRRYFKIDMLSIDKQVDYRRFFMMMAKIKLLDSDDVF